MSPSTPSILPLTAFLLVHQGIPIMAFQPPPSTTRVDLYSSFSSSSPTPLVLNAENIRRRVPTATATSTTSSGSSNAPFNTVKPSSPANAKVAKASSTAPNKPTTKTSTTTLESILDDGKGHINADLARAIYEWEVAHQSSSSSDDESFKKNGGGDKKRQFSARDGLRLVDELAREILSSVDIVDKGVASSSSPTASSSSSSMNNNNNNNNNVSSSNSNLTYNDLVQEGMIALLHSMSTYNNYKKSQLNNNNNNNNAQVNTIATFEQYAKQCIHSSLLHFLASSSRPIRLPLSLETTLQRANTAASKLRNQWGKEPTLVQVAKEVNMEPKQLALYRKLYRTMGGNSYLGGGGGGGSSYGAGGDDGDGGGRRSRMFVSVEDGVETYDPTMIGVGVGLDSVRLESVSDRTTSSPSSSSNDAEEGSSASSSLYSILSAAMSNEGLTSSPSTATTPSEQDLLQINIQEDDWVTQPPERMVAPLRDILKDTEEINNPLSYTHHHLLNESLDQFLTQTLSKEELEVIQLRFGLVDSKYGGRGWKVSEICGRMGLEREEVVRIASVALEKLRVAAKELEDQPPLLAYWEDDDPYVEVSL